MKIREKMITATALKKSFNEEHVIEHQRTKFLAMYNMRYQYRKSTMNMSMKK